MYNEYLIFPAILCGVVIVFIISQRSIVLTGGMLITAISWGTIRMMNNSFNTTGQANYLTLFFLVVGGISVAAIGEFILRELQKRNSIE